MKKKIFMGLGVLVLSCSLWAAEAYDYESITVSNTAVGFTAAKLAPTFSEKPTQVFFTVETDAIRFRIDGTDPTASEGHKLSVGDAYVITSLANLKKFRMIRVSTDATVKVSYERGAAN